jgi:hypothetical protein
LIDLLVLAEVQSGQNSKIDPGQSGQDKDPGQDRPNDIPDPDDAESY